MFNIKILLSLSVFCFKFLIGIRSECILNYPKSIENAPRYEKHISIYKLQIPYNGKQIKLEENEIISGYCDTQFSSISYEVVEIEKIKSSHYRSGFGSYDVYENVPKKVKKSLTNQTSITLTCRNGQLTPVQENVLECKKFKWSIYESKDESLWCQKNQNSKTFLLATKLAVNHHILASICYNWEQLSLQTVNYNVTYPQRNDMEMHMGISKTNLQPHQTLTDDLWNFKITKTSEISEELLQEQLSNLGNTNLWLNLANYELASIVQADTYGKYFKEYDNILNIIWWHNLRMGNWKRFMNTLENYAYNNSFQLFTGTSDMVRYPTDQKCEKNNLLEIKIGFKNETVPGYIWTYIKSNDNSNEDFIIVGYNSPYAEFFTLKDIVFCPDICSEIPWLSEIQSYFRYSFAGIMFCCSTDFIRQTNYLHGFPMDLLMADQEEVETETDIIETTELEVTTEEEIYLGSEP